MIKHDELLTESDFLVSPQFLQKTGLRFDQLMNIFSAAVGRLMTLMLADGNLPGVDIGDHDLCFVLGTSQADLDKLMTAVKFIENETGFRPKVGLSQMVFV